LNPKLRKIVNKINDKALRKKVAQLVEKPSIEIDGKVFAGLPLDRSPASISNHHSYPGGWLEHVVATAEVALTLCGVVEDVYRGRVNRDLVLCGVILHDIFKPLTYVERQDGTYEASPLAENLDHLTLAVSELIRRAFPMALIHIVCAHHAEFGPISPKTLEALIVNLADVVDSRLNGKVLRAAGFLSRRATGVDARQLSSRDAFEIVQIKAEKGLEAVRKYVTESHRE
jgi:7,8-dihydroneopterin 2',3'-cyclic phosphate phosphodiesterase